MLAGDFERALRESDFIAASAAPDPSRLWDGEPWRDRRLIPRCLRGCGDAIQFISHAPILPRDAASMVVETHPEMISLEALL